ncbi:hypothetical protein L917_07734 [Phytophthora nicotianae]|uniref:Uncharacterized protein n=1 Tax=Phytophthora nicotianae TaxID=4792 RepID=W2LC84_PHYNI|nr:hypothetical protein L917_07734 [Phytophthora nicotianae]
MFEKYWENLMKDGKCGQVLRWSQLYCQLSRNERINSKKAAILSIRKSYSGSSNLKHL